MEWETVYGSAKIYKSKHLVTYGGGPEGGYVYFYKERDPGWYRWHRTWFQPPTYTRSPPNLGKTVPSTSGFSRTTGRRYTYMGPKRRCLF